MRRVSVIAAAAIVFAFAAPAHAQTVAYEGARLIIGDGTVVDNGTVVVDGGRITAAGAGVNVPAGAQRVNLAGKTVMPMIIDTHVHLSTTREGLINDLKRRAYFGVSAALNIGLNVLWVPTAGPQGSAVATLVSFSVLLMLSLLGLGRPVIQTRPDVAVWSLCIAAAAFTLAANGVALWLAAGCLVAGLVPLRVVAWRVLRPPPELVERSVRRASAP